MSDDAYIHAAFTKGILLGKSFSYNGNVTYGSTSPLWTILVAIFSRLFHLDIIVSLRFLSALFSISLILVFYNFITIFC